MKLSQKTTPLLCALITLGLTTSYAAGPNRGGGGSRTHGGKLHGDRGDRKEARLEMGPKKEKFKVWKKAVFGGARYFSEQDRKLRRQYHTTYQHIEKGLINDKINENSGREFKQALRKIGEKAGELRGEEKQLSEEDRDTIKADLDTLNHQIKEKGIETGKVPEALATPTINKKQNWFENLLSWANEDGVLANGKTSSFRRKLKSLETKEARYKADGKLSDRERETLHEEAWDLGRDILKAIRAA